MSRENVEIVRAAIDAFNRGDWDAALEGAAPWFELDFSRAAGPDHGVFTLDQTRGFWDEFVGGWDSARLEPGELIEADEQVVVPVTVYTRGRDGIELAARPAYVFTISDGSLTRICMYQEVTEALEAAGLQE